MSVHSSLLSSQPPSPHHIIDFDLVTLDGRLILVGSPDRDRLACTWDPASHRWTQYELDIPDEEFPYTELTSIGAAVVDGRIVIGGGGDHQGFAMWDLETGKVRLSAQEGGTSSVVRADFGDRSRLLVGFTGTWGVELWDPSVAEPGDRHDDDGDLEDEDDEDDSVTEPERPSPYDSLVNIEELECKSRASSAAAAGLLAGRPVVVAGGRDGGVLVWDIEEERHLAEFDDLDETSTEFALASVDGRIQVLAAGGQSLVLGDPESNEWGEPLTVPGDEISCLTAGTVYGRPFAVTGAMDGTICVWDLAEHRLLGQSLRGHISEVLGLRVAYLDSRPMIISTAHCDSVHLWEFPL
ncbi:MULTISPECIES: WD40 repeat domain-containing protein [unclassified Spirillospora]|uniref:WD40 repeat domain-containing protein n=1 Tax=unclassified Spirillospora TaxID=2642701 RepID=UPI0037148F2B